ncbi:MAG: ribonuclease-3 [Halieaceae bacterium]|jgi:ribonuclease-3
MLCRLDDAQLLQQALTHRSVGKRNNERLEFLGDAVLGCVISELLYERFPDADEGQLSRLRVALVKGTALAAVAREIDLGEQLRLGSGERHGGGRRRDSILADALEAVIGAVVLDQGIAVCSKGVLHLFRSRLENSSLDTVRKDPKTRLQEHLQGLGRPLPRYALVEHRGEDHERVFTMACMLDDGPEEVKAEGASRRTAEQVAAEGMLQRLGAL